MSKVVALPGPMTPPDCDLRGLPYMPLDVVRLIDSDLFALSTGDEFKCAMALWCKSWLQVPAASLPDDDRILAHLSSAGMGWQNVRAMSLHGWVKCSDGRLYHPVLAEKALVAWRQRLVQRGKANKRWEKKPGDATPPSGGIAAAHAAASKNGATAHPAASKIHAAALPLDAAAYPTAMPMHMQGKEKLSKKEAATSDFVQTPREEAAPVPGPSCEPESPPRPEPVIPRDPRKMPKRSDPENLWRWMGACHEDEMDPVTMKHTKFTMRNGSQLRTVVENVCQAARIDNEHWRGDWWTVTTWLDAGIEPGTITRAIGKCFSRPGFTPKETLAYFDRPVREAAGLLPKERAA